MSSPSKSSVLENLSTGFRWSYGDHHFIGFSIAGVTTSVVYENVGLVFDIGQGLPFNIPRHHYFLTHCHSDHAGGLAYVLSQRSLWNLPPATVYTLPQYQKPLTAIIEQWQELEDFKYPFTIQAMNIGESVSIDKDYDVESFKTIHRVASQGYIVKKKKKKLKPEFQNLSPQELKKLHESGVGLNTMISEPIFAFTGDTQIEFLEHLKTPVDVLFMETTFIDDLKTIENARTWGHIHFYEWLDKLEQIPAQKIVLIHLSSRYSTPRILEILDQKIPAHLRDRVDIFPRPF